MLERMRESVIFQAVRRPTELTLKALTLIGAGITVTTIVGLLGLTAQRWFVVLAAAASALVSWLLAAAILATKEIRNLQASLLAARADVVTAQRDEGRAVVKNDQLRADKRTLALLIELLPSDSGSLWFLEHHPWSNSYEDESLTDLNEYHYKRGPEHWFLDPSIRESEDEFRNAISGFKAALGTHTFMREGGDYRVYPEYDADWEIPDNKFVFDAIREIESKAANVVDTHKRLVEVARQELGDAMPENQEP